MTCDVLGTASSATFSKLAPQVINSRDNLEDFVLNPKYQLEFLEATLLGASRVEFHYGGHDYTIKVGCGKYPIILSSLDIDTIAWQAGTTVRITFVGVVDLTGVEVGDFIKIESAGNASNNGTFVISDANDGAQYIEFDNPARTDATDDEVSDSTAVGTVYDAKVIEFYELPSGWSTSLPCDDPIVTEFTFSNCHGDMCCGGFGYMDVNTAAGVWTFDSEYHPSDVDDAADPKYYGFTTSNGDWYVLKVDGESYTYAVPEYNTTYSDYPSAWSSRAVLTYSEFFEINN